MGYKGPALILTFAIMYYPDHSNCSAGTAQVHGRCVFLNSKYYRVTPQFLLPHLQHFMIHNVVNSGFSQYRYTSHCVG